MKEEEEVEVLHSWVEAGGHPACPEEEVKELLAEVSSFSCFSILPISLHLVIGTEFCCFNLAIHFDPFLFLFQGLWSLQQASMLRKEARRLEERVHDLETEGWRQMREVVAGSEAEGLYGPLKGVVSYPTLPHPILPLRSPVFPPVPPSSSHPFKSPQDPKSQVLQVRPLCPPLQLLLQLQRRTYWPTCNPLGFKWGAQSACTSARLRVAKRAHQPHGLPFVPM